MEKLGLLRGDSSLSTWLYRVTSNLCVDFARKRAAEGSTASIDDAESPAASIPDPSRAIQPEQAAENQELREELQYALAQLSENTAEWFCCVMWQGFLIRKSHVLWNWRKAL